MYLAKKIRRIIGQAMNMGCTLEIEGVLFINATGEKIVFDDGTHISGSKAICEDFDNIALKKLTKEFKVFRRFAHFTREQDVFDTGGQSFQEYSKKKKPLIIVSSPDTAMLLGKPTIVPFSSARKGKTNKQMWAFYGWRLGNPYRL